MSLQNLEKKLILASASTGRAALLSGAGLTFDIIPSSIDEPAVREALSAVGERPTPADLAEILARAKAEDVSARHPQAYVIGADQTLALEGEVFEKPADLETARENLLRFRGKTHYLHAAICVAREGRVLWSEVRTAALTMRDFSPQFLGRYLAAAGDSVLSSVGAYRLESVGVHLFSRIEGDYFTILGLPLLPLLAFLRQEGVVIS